MSDPTPTEGDMKMARECVNNMNIAANTTTNVRTIARALMAERAKWEAEIATLRAENERLKIEISAARLSLTHPHGEIGVGADVEKVSGYRWPGEVRSVFTTRAGKVRFVVECTVPEVAGALHIYSGDQITRAAIKGGE